MLQHTLYEVIKKFSQACQTLWRWESEARGFFCIETAAATELSPIENILAIVKTGQCGEMLCRPYVASWWQPKSKHVALYPQLNEEYM